MIAGEYKVWHIPNVPGHPVEIVVETLPEAMAVQDALANYDLELLDRGLRGDFSNASGIAIWNSEDQDWEDLDDFEIESRT